MPTSWGGSSRLPDGARWRELAAGATDLPAMVAVCRQVRDEVAALDLPTSLRTLAALAEGSHVVARLVQCDQEAVALLREAGAPVPDEILVLFPPEPASVRATAGADGWTVTGRQRRSTHPGAVGSAVLVASTDEGPRPFLVRLGEDGVVADDPTPPRLIAPEDPNRAVTFAGVAATPVASAAWWAARPRSSSAGLLRDAACWFGACVWLCRALETAALAGSADPSRRVDPAELERAGRVDVWVHAARLALRSAIPAALEDPDSAVAELAARRAVATIATTAETVVRSVARASDARTAEQDEALGARVAQLQIALRRFDPAGNLRAIGALLTAGVDPTTVSE